MGAKLKSNHTSHFATFSDLDFQLFSLITFCGVCDQVRQNESQRGASGYGRTTRRSSHHPPVYNSASPMRSHPAFTCCVVMLMFLLDVWNVWFNFRYSAGSKVLLHWPLVPPFLLELGHKSSATMLNPALHAPLCTS